MNRGVLYAASAYACWGLLPVFWKLLQHIDAFEIVAHRIIWALAFAVILLTIGRRWSRIGVAWRNWRVLATFLITGVLLTANWFVYIWGVNTNHIVETSLGYFINPLVNVLLGAIVLKERLRVGQGVAMSVALIGVLYLTFQYGSFPWIALILAGTFALYSLLRKTASLDSLDGFSLETALLAPPMIAFLAYRELTTHTTFIHSDPLTWFLLVAAGPVTAIPLLLFAAGARRVSLVTLGVLQYIAPTLQFLIGVGLYDEPLTLPRLIGFVLIWTALAIYTFDSVMYRQAVAAPVSAAPGDV
ncbi:EamA family transporter RarD [Roseiflexus sp.]|uniref:EamA family transporter RarD n=1 Tax=Roseiflexus sp. TaxID=2562120 RepID=UPI00398B8080